jgi:hypothetical protein
LKRFPLILLAGLLPFTDAEAGLRLGLGDAVAKRSVELIEKAAAADLANATGDAVAATLPNCSAGALYDTAPTDLAQIGGIDPLGHVAPPPHTLPSDHIYFYATTTTVVSPPVYAPGPVHITQIAASTYLSATPVRTDYSVYFYPCREVMSYFFHVQALSPALAQRVGAIDQNCNTYSTGGTTVRRCDRNVNLTMSGGEAIGTSSGAFDFGTYDFRITPLAFASPARHYATQAYTVCPVDYFAPGPKAAMEAKLGRADGGYPRTVAPVCGAIQFDLPGTARGDWYHVGSPDSPEDPHLALIPNNVYADRQELSIGTSLTGQSPSFYIFIPTHAGQVDRDFAEVTADGTIYCYDAFYDPIGQAIGPGPTFILQMLSSTTLQIERQAPTSCGAGPWAFTSNAVTFQR